MVRWVQLCRYYAPECDEKFLEVTLDAYKRAVGDEFGKIVDK